MKNIGCFTRTLICSENSKLLHRSLHCGQLSFFRIFLFLFIVLGYLTSVNDIIVELIAGIEVRGTKVNMF